MSWSPVGRRFTKAWPVLFGLAIFAFAAPTDALAQMTVTGTVMEICGGIRSANLDLDLMG